MTEPARRSLPDDAVAIFRAGLLAADPYRATRKALRDEQLRKALAREPVRILAIGKAACSMADAARDTLAASVFARPGLVVVNHENRREVEGYRVLGAGHPVPDERGLEASRAVTRVLEKATTRDTILLLISGGGSAVLPAPAPGISLDDKIETTRLLLSSGANIREINTVRKHLSTLKGGGLARAAYPAALQVLLLSDVAGDDLSTIASGLSVPDPTTFSDAQDVLRRYRLTDHVPGTVREHFVRGLLDPARETPKPGDPVFDRVENRLVGSNALSLEEAAATAYQLGYRVEVAADQLEGEAREAGSWLATRAVVAAKIGRPVALLCGGETTVTVQGAGRGGRNQELALSFALAAAELASLRPWALLSAGTDGRDGPTDAAGGLVGPDTLERGRRAGRDPARDLSENDSYAFLDAAGSLLKTGPTGTNVADLQVLLLGPTTPTSSQSAPEVTA